MRPLAAYFENLGRAKTALSRYRQFADDQNWSIRDSKLSLYRSAKTAFNESVIEQDRKAAFSHIYRSLQAWWQVFRGSPTHWNETQIYDALTQRCRETSRNGSMTLISDLTNNPCASTLVAHLERLREIKTISWYPTMVVSKFSHFFNPSLFPIYDTEIIYKTVINGTFRDDYKSINPRTPPLLILDDKDGIWDAYYWVAWGNEVMRRRHAELMDYFAEWFVENTRTDGDDVSDLREDLRAYYATAFEFIAIGAAHFD